MAAERVLRELRLRSAERRFALASCLMTSRTLARRSTSANGTPFAGPSAFTKTRPPSSAKILGLVLLRMASLALSLQSSAAMRSPGRRRQKRPEPLTRWPSTRRRSGRPEANVSPSIDLDLVERQRRSSRPQAAPGSCTCRCRCPACRRPHATVPSSRSCTLASAANRAAIQAAAGHAPAQRQAVALHRADCRRALRPAKLLCAEFRALDASGVRKTASPFDSSIFGSLKMRSRPDRS